MLKEIQFNSKEERRQFFRHPGNKHLEPSIRHRLEKNDKKLAVMLSISGFMFGILFIPLLLVSSRTLSMVLLSLSMAFVFAPCCWWFYSNGKIFYELTGSIWLITIALVILITFSLILIVVYYEFSPLYNMIIPLCLLLLYISWHIDNIRIMLKKRSSKS